MKELTKIIQLLSKVYADSENLTPEQETALNYALSFLFKLNTFLNGLTILGMEFTNDLPKGE